MKKYLMTSSVNVYVPEVIPYTDSYLLSYLGEKLRKPSSASLKNTLYATYEVIDQEWNWFKYQLETGEIIYNVRFGGVGVKKRQRIKND